MIRASVTILLFFLAKVFCAHHPKMALAAKDGQRCDFDICEDIVDYPHDGIKLLLKMNKDIHASYFGNVIKPQVQPTVLKTRNNFMPVTEEPEPFCNSRTITKYPKMLKDINGTWQLIVNIDPPHIQAISFEICDCTKEHSYCYNPSFGKHARCEQKYTIMKLLKSENNELGYGDFRIPSSCICKFSENEDDYDELPSWCEAE